MTTSQPSTTKMQKRLQRRDYILQRVMLYGAIILGLNVASYIPAYLNLRAWQILADMGFTLFETACSLIAYLTMQRGNPRRAYPFMIVALLGMPLTQWFLGFNLSILVASSLAVLIMSMAVWLDAWYAWMSVSTLYLAYGFFISMLSPLQPLSPNQITYLSASDWISAIAFAGLMIYEGARILPTTSIRNRLLLISINLAFLPAITITIVFTTTTINNTRTQVFNQLSSVAQLKRNQIALWQSTLQNYLRALNTDTTIQEVYTTLIAPRIAEDDKQAAYVRLQQRLKDQLAASQYFDELFLVDLSGQVVASTMPQRERQIVTTTTFFTLGSLAPSIQPPTYDLTTNAPSIIFSRPLLDKNGTTIGLLAGRANINVLNNIMQERTGLGESGETYLVGLNRALLTETHTPLPLTGSRYVRTEGINQAIQSKTGGQSRYENYAGEPVYGVYKWLPDLQVALLAEQNVAEAQSGVFRALIISGGVAFAAVFVAIVIALVLTNSISRPLQQLGETASRITQGNLEIQAQVTGEDEVSLLAQAFNAMTARLRNTISGLEGTVEERTREIQQRSRQLEIVVQISNIIVSIRDTNTLLERVTHLISHELGFYHIGIFLLDEDKQYAVLRATNSEGGQRMLARSHKLRVGQVGIVGYVADRRQARIALDVGEDAVFFDNPDLPETRSEIALPLIAGQTLLGVLDVQSKQSNAFTEEDVRILQLLADQLAVAIENAELFAQSQQALEEAQRTYGTLSRDAWQKLLQGVLRGGYTSNSSGLQIIKNPEVLPTAAHQAVKKHSLAVVEQADGQHIAIPIQIRGLTIGTLETFKPQEAGRWAQEELETLQAITDELSRALDGARLYTETQLRAENERRLSRIAGEVRSSLDIEDVLQTAVRQIQEAFTLAEVEIRMEHSDEEYS